MHLDKLSTWEECNVLTEGFIGEGKDGLGQESLFSGLVLPSSGEEPQSAGVSLALEGTA